MPDYLAGLKIDTADYQDFRPCMKTGDALVFAGPAWWHKMVGWWGKPKNSSVGLSHASMVFRPAEYQSWKDRVFVIETTGSGGLRPKLLSEKLFHHHGRCFHISTNLSRKQRLRIQEEAFLLACSDIAYDYGGCFSNIFFRPKIVGDYYCSEFMGDMWRMGGYADPERSPRPNDIPALALQAWPDAKITEIIMRVV